MRLSLALAMMTLALTACGEARKLAVRDAFVRLAAVEGRPAAAYFTLEGGAADATLVSVSTDAAIRVELHESMAASGGMMTMDAVPAVPVKAGATVAFTPGGKHAMLFDVNPRVKPGARVPLTFAFADGTKLRAEASVIAAGDPAPR